MSLENRGYRLSLSLKVNWAFSSIWKRQKALRTHLYSINTQTGNNAKSQKQCRFRFRYKYTMINEPLLVSHLRKVTGSFERLCKKTQMYMKINITHIWTQHVQTILSFIIFIFWKHFFGCHRVHKLSPVYSKLFLVPQMQLNWDFVEFNSHKIFQLGFCRIQFS